MAGVALGDRSSTHAASGHSFCAGGRVCLEHDGAQEGQYRFEWLEKAVAMAQKHGIYVVLGTPTAAPPAWLTSKYPDTLRSGRGRPTREARNRQHFDFTSERYRQFCRQIAGEMAKRFGHNPDVIGWQIDNEYATYSYDPETQRQFQQWLKKKFGTLDSLNQHWTTAYWSETYRQVGRDSDSGWLQQSGPDAGVETIRQRYLPVVSKEPDRCDSSVCRSAAMDHPQLHGMVRRIRSLHGERGSGHGIVG